MIQASQSVPMNHALTEYRRQSTSRRVLLGKRRSSGWPRRERTGPGHYRWLPLRPAHHRGQQNEPKSIHETYLAFPYHDVYFP